MTAATSKRSAKATTAPANEPTAQNNGASAGAKTVPDGPKRAPARRRRARIGPRQGAGDRLTADIAKPGDTAALKLLITQAARCADRLEALDRVLRGDASTWLRLEAAALVDRGGKVPARVTVELKVDDAVREERQQAKLFATLLADIHRQRAALPPAPPSNGGTGGKRSLMNFEDLDED